MTKVEFEIPAKLLEQAAGETITALQKKIKTQESKIKKLEARLAKKLHDEKLVFDLDRAVRTFIQTLRDNEGFTDEFHYE